MWHLPNKSSTHKKVWTFGGLKMMGFVGITFPSHTGKARHLLLNPREVTSPAARGFGAYSTELLILKKR